MTTKKGYGEILKKAREEKKLTYAEVHKVLRVDPAYIKGMEDEVMDVFEKPIYMKLFLKTYANFLKLDYKKILEMYEETLEVLEPDEKKDRQHNLIMNEMLKESTTEILQPSTGMDNALVNRRNLILLGSVVAAVVLLVVILALTLGKKGNSGNEANNNVYVATVTAPASLRVTARAKEDVWMKARYDGTEDDFLLKRGEERKWKDTNRIVFLVGNAGGVEFTVNNDTIGAIGEPGEVINGLVFETGKNWYIDRAQGFKRENPKPAVPTTVPTATPAAAAPADVVQ
ncbi:MAG: helix-turn-helix domain-containing protein [Spirochaetia bacterium]|nr:helix-turn-helix domain-containing protein [Spirochaetia bacterium]